MNELVGQPGELHMTLVIKRANGDEQTVNLIGHVLPETQEIPHGGNALDGGEERCD